MIKLTWLELGNPYFQQAVSAIWDCPMLDGHTSYCAHRIMQGTQGVEKQIAALRIELCNKYSKKDEAGKTVTERRKGHDGREMDFVVFDTPEKNKEFEDEFNKEFKTRVLELKVNKINFEKIVTVRGITPRMWEYLIPIMDNLPDEERVEELLGDQSP